MNNNEESDVEGFVELHPEDAAPEFHSALEIMLSTIVRHGDDVKWVDAPFEAIKRVSNTKVGSVGQDFLEQFALQYGITVVFPVNARGDKAKQSPWDISLNGVRFELKTATEDVGGKFQFNHVRYHREYDGLICLGISPTRMYLGMWTKSEVLTGKAGRLVSMEKNANASFKLTKSPHELQPVETLPDQLAVVVDLLQRGRR